MTTREIVLDGKPFLVNTEDACISSWLLRGDKFDVTEMALIRKAVKAGDSVVDIGANIGLYTVLLSELVGPTGKVYAFEPDPDNFAILQWNLKIRGIANVQAEQIALYSHAGKLPLYSGGINKGAHSVVYRASATTPSTEVWALTYEGYFRGLPPIAFIKIDAEGAEANILAGAPSVFDKDLRQPQAMMFEYNDTMQIRATESMELTMTRLIDAGFSLSVIGDNLISTFTKHDMPRVMAGMGGAYVNIWCAR